MTTFAVVITDQHQLDSITAARNAYNAQNTDAPNFVHIDTDAGYVQFVMSNAAASYATQYGT